jgi:hypothetical protein
MQITDEMVRAGYPFVDTGDPYNTPTEDDFRAALNAALAHMWRPIEEAPDSETVIVGGGDAVYPVTASWDGRFDEGEGWWVDGQEDIHCEIGWPTHFMPLPAPPKTGGE